MKSFLAAVAMVGLSGAAFADSTQAYSPSVTLFAYEKGVENFCPAGTQPIRYMGVVCCGVPNATGYSDAPVIHRKVAQRMAPTYSARIPLGKSPNSYDGM
ncbi:hypothetical protein [Pacificibacter maritimus]|uniref:hypothetical protein n=1 Tax=Pacificibacter maritimus TaxID=762213 RepID=UPI000F51758E|nr:hypothetical protein [Pacificibacter maritimus]